MKADIKRRQQRIAELKIKAEIERVTLGRLTGSYLHITSPFDRFCNRAIHTIQARPITTTLLLGLGGIAAVFVVRRLPVLPLLGFIRGATMATTVLRSLRRP